MTVTERIYRLTHKKAIKNVKAIPYYWKYSIFTISIYRHTRTMGEVDFSTDRTLILGSLFKSNRSDDSLSIE